MPVTLKRFFALELVLTFGIFYTILLLRPCRRSEQTETYGAMWAICFEKKPFQTKHKTLKRGANVVKFGGCKKKINVKIVGSSK